MTVPDPGDRQDAALKLAEPHLRLPRSMAREIIEHLRAALPNEGCGLISAHRAAEGDIVAARFFPGPNSDESPVRYTIEAAAVIGAFKVMRQLDQELGAIVHSHPLSEAEPSPTDFHEAYYPDALMLIVSFAKEPPALRAWRIIETDGGHRAMECQILYE